MATSDLLWLDWIERGCHHSYVGGFQRSKDSGKLSGNSHAVHKKENNWALTKNQKEIQGLKGILWHHPVIFWPVMKALFPGECFGLLIVRRTILVLGSVGYCLFITILSRFLPGSKTETFDTCGFFLFAAQCEHRPFFDVFLWCLVVGNGPKVILEMGDRSGLTKKIPCFEVCFINYSDILYTKTLCRSSIYHLLGGGFKRCYTPEN